LWSGALKLPHELPYNEFVDTLGPGQKVGRQVLGSPCLGELQMSIMIEKNQLAIEIIRARNLKVKSGYRLLPGEAKVPIQSKSSFLFCFVLIEFSLEFKLHM
jgi:hypothetical protein